ncbi:protein-glutamine gamma-glutamyltransferase [Geobacter sp. OR-1]|uniref:transglutaminase family protein n=1 Tax=Geobacter sp. OR-1 TaxID=1266765 RepID=UPI0005427698|nr:DUF3488 and transglutaminase-like domain-containing protein [Geobacter sp. OR-1]GAM10038.1 protein-glutamine gamma-glutamyltransferase [Geobacter sp. OR-1]
MNSPAKLVEILVLAASVAGILPLYPYLEFFPKIFLPLAALVGIFMTKRGMKVPPAILTLVSIVVFIYYALQAGHGNVVAPAANLLASFLAIRLMGEKSGRAFLQTSALSIFCLAASTLFALGPVFLGSLILLAFLLVCILVLLTFQETEQSIVLNRFELRSLGKLVLAITGVTIPLMLLFFIILPRTQFPLWNAFVGQEAASAGISDRVEPGRSSNIDTGRAVAFRAEMPPLDNEMLYWRCTVFNRYSTNAWLRNAPPAGEADFAGPGKRIQQTIFAEPGRLRYLPALDPPLQVRAARTSTSADLVTSQRMGGLNRIKYEAVSMPGETIKVRNGIDRKFYLGLPTELPPRLAKAADEIRSRGRSDRERLALAREFFLASKLSYTTSNLPTGKDHLDKFLFIEKKGHCEYFASSFALIMRVADVPARVVGGYYGGVYNQLGGYFVVSDDMAHAWTEVFIDGEGWRRIDPSRWSAGFADIGATRGKGLLQRLATMLDTFSYFWNVTVITYDLGSQLKLARNTGELLRNAGMADIPRPSAKTILQFVTVGAALTAILLLARYCGNRTDKQLAAQFIRLSGYDQPPPGKGIMEIAAEWGDSDAERFAVVYSGAIYTDRKISTAEREELQALLRKLKARRAKA